MIIVGQNLVRILSDLVQGGYQAPSTNTKPVPVRCTSQYQYFLPILPTPWYLGTCHFTGLKIRGPPPGTKILRCLMKSNMGNRRKYIPKIIVFD